MIKRNSKLKNRKRERIKINNINDLKEALKKEGYNINECDKQKFKEEIASIFGKDNSVTERLFTCLRKRQVTYKVEDVRDFIDYIEKMILFENVHNILINL